MTETKMIGKRIVVTGIAGAGKSTFSKLLAAKEDLPLEAQLSVVLRSQREALL